MYVVNKEHIAKICFRREQVAIKSGYRRASDLLAIFSAIGGQEENYCKLFVQSDYGLKLQSYSY